jgi:GT2 family glycosyltransferase
LTGDESSAIGVTVVVPTYRRPGLLMRCLAGISDQSHPPAATIVVQRVDDELTRSCLAGTLPLNPTVVTVDRPGQVAAMAAGLAATQTPLVAFTDDDAVPRRDWLARLLEPFADHGVGAVGGRDVIGGDGTAYRPSAERVGVISHWGRLVGNHHIGIGAPRDVDVLKGVNCIYRRSVIAIPQDLRGSGAQVYNEVAIGLRTQALGWRLVYDPQILVDHYPGPRFDADDRSGPAKSAIFDAAYNLTYSVGSFGVGRALRRITYAVLVGDRALPGIARTLVALMFESGPQRRDLFRKLGPALSGNVFAAVQLARGRRVRFDAC